MKIPLYYWIVACDLIIISILICGFIYIANSYKKQDEVTRRDKARIWMYILYTYPMALMFLLEYIIYFKSDKPFDISLFVWILLTRIGSAAFIAVAVPYSSGYKFGGK